jgi:hypothetical protein
MIVIMIMSNILYIFLCIIPKLYMPPPPPPPLGVPMMGPPPSPPRPYSGTWHFITQFFSICTITAGFEFKWTSLKNVSGNTDNKNRVEVCRDFLKNMCTRESCRFLHPDTHTVVCICAFSFAVFFSSIRATHLQHFIFCIYLTRYQVTMLKFAVILNEENATDLPVAFSIHIQAEVSC